MRKGTRIVLALSLLVNLAGVVVVGAYLHRAGVSNTLVKLGIRTPVALDYAALAEERFADLPGAPLVVLGDSQVQDGPFGEILGESARRGIGGATIEDVTDMIPAAVGPEARHVIVEVGTNDALLGHTEAEIASDYRKLIAALTDAGVSATFLTVPPPRDLQGEVATVNEALAKACEETDTPLVDVVPILAPDGYTDDRFTLDGTHLGPDGYAAIAPLLQQAAQAG